MNVINGTTAIAVGLIALSACQPPPPADTTVDMAAIRANGAEWDKSYNSGNADAIVALYSDDAVLMPPGAPAASGKTAMKTFLAANIAESAAAGLTLAIDANAATAGASGDLGWRSGTFTVSDKAGATVDTGKWLEVWHKTGDKWHITRDIWNSDRKATTAVPLAATLGPTGN